MVETKAITWEAGREWNEWHGSRKVDWMLAKGKAHNTAIPYQHERLIFSTGEYECWYTPGWVDGWSGYFSFSKEWIALRVSGDKGYEIHDTVRNILNGICVNFNGIGDIEWIDFFLNTIKYKGGEKQAMVSCLAWAIWEFEPRLCVFQAGAMNFQKMNLSAKIWSIIQ